MPSSAVIDASFAMAMFVLHQKAVAAKAIHDQSSDADVSMIAPTLWLYEVASSIQKLSYFGQISTEHTATALVLAEQFSISLIPPDFYLARRALLWSCRLGRSNAYDSLYLALAEERGCDLWTADTRLSNAVNRNWVRLLA
jgi:predicted nucleic acid-binding protein